MPAKVLPDGDNEVARTVSREDAETMTNEMNDVLGAMHNGIRFRLSGDGGNMVVQIIDRETEEVIREVPSEDLVEIREKFDEAMGVIFDKGLALRDPQSGTPRITISRIAAASRSLDWFFTRWLPRFLRARYPDTYTVYAGGDDLLLVGPWSEILDLLLDLRENFRRYVAGNPHITFSAGVVICAPHTPIHIAVQAADRLLEEAKDRDALGREGDQFGRNQVACLGTILEWDRFEKALSEGKRLADWTSENLLSKSMLHTLMWSARQIQSFRRSRNVQALRWVPHLAYQIGRLDEPRDDEKRDKWKQALNWLVRLKENGLRDLPADRVTDLDALRLVADYAAHFAWEGKE